MRKVAILPNLRKEYVIDVCQEVVNWFLNAGIEVIISEELSQRINRKLPSLSECDEVDMAVVLGGDGTLLFHARQRQWHGIPILGINLGHLGFLSEVEVGELWAALPQLVKGDYYIEERMMCRIQVFRRKELKGEFIALNEVVVSKGAISRMIRLETFVGGEFLDTYPADGLIVATPTGSTAYSLSAGGPIVNPQMDLMIITPIAAHTLSAKPIIIPAVEIVEIVPEAEHNDLHLTVDGQEHYELRSGDRIRISRYAGKVNLVRLWRRPFYEVLRKKLRCSLS